MQKYFKVILKYILVAINLRQRTILARMRMYPSKTSKKEINFNNPVRPIFSNEIILKYPIKVDVFINGNIVKVLNDEFDLSKFINNASLDKNDYLHYYTFFYLNWKNLDYELQKNNDQLLKIISQSNISKEPFVISQQAFNLIVKSDNIFIYNSLLKEHYFNLKKKIEYFVDGNHVLENLISLVLLEIYFFQSTEFIIDLFNEVKRQTNNGMHVEKNLKYSNDLSTKLRILLSIDFFENNYLYEKNNIINIINEWDCNSLFVMRNFPIVHDNIDGDELVFKYFSGNNKLEIEKDSFFGHINIRPINGFRGHSFDINYLLSFKSIVYSFGTITYANCSKRDYQRLRYNNIQPCFTKKDIGMFFWKSFRHLFSFPSMTFKWFDSTYFIEILYSNNWIKLLNYKLVTYSNGFDFISTKEIVLCLRFDNISVVSNNRVKIENFEIIAIDGQFIVKKSLRASGINNYKSCYQLEFTGKHYKYLIA